MNSKWSSQLLLLLHKMKTMMMIVTMKKMNGGRKRKKLLMFLVNNTNSSDYDGGGGGGGDEWPCGDGKTRQRRRRRTSSSSRSSSLMIIRQSLVLIFIAYYLVASVSGGEVNNLNSNNNINNVTTMTRTRNSGGGESSSSRSGGGGTKGSAFNRLRKLLKEQEMMKNNNLNSTTSFSYGGGGTSGIVRSSSDATGLNTHQVKSTTGPVGIVGGLTGRVNRNIHTRNLISYGIVSGGTTDSSGGKDSIHIAGFFPTSSFVNISSEGAIGRGVLPAVKLAIFHINNNNHTLPDYKLHITWNDTKCSASDGMKVFFDMMHKLPRKYMLFGDACTQVTDPIAKASRYWKVAQLSYADMHPMFSKKNYPNLFRIVPSENEFNAPRLALLQKFNWTRVGTLYQNQPRYSLAHNKLVADLESMNVSVVAAQSFADDITYHIHKLKEKDVRIILGNFNETWARRIFCEAYREKLYGRKYQWLIVAAYTPTWWRKQDDVNCTFEEVETALKGALLMDLLPLSTSSDITISGLTAERYNEMYQVVKLNEYSRFHGYAYDGIWAIALALHNMSNYYPDPVHRHRKDLLRTFDYHDDKWQTAFLRALEATSFTGVTGKVEFKDNGRKGTILIKQFRAFNTVNAEVKVGEFDGVTETLSLLTSKDNQIVWNGKNPPKDRTIEIIEHTRVNPTLFATMTIASSVGIVLACFFLAINIKFRNQRYIKMSSPYLNNLIIIGCIFTYTSVITLGLDSKLTSIEAFPYICTARAWVLMAGFSLAFGSMFSKTWRVHSIFTNVKLNKKVIKDMQLFIVVGILLAIDFAIMTSWHFLDPMYRDTKKLEAYTNPNNDDIQIIPENEYCKSQYMNYFVGSIYAYKGLLMLFGCFLAWETRHVSIPALNDSKYIGMSVYNCVMMCVLGAPLSHVLTDKHDASFLIISVFIIFCTTATLCLVFLPKVIELKRNPKGTVEKRLRTTIKPPSQTRRASATSMYEAELKTAKQENQKIRKQIREVDNEIQALAKILGEDAQDILHDAMHNLALPKSEVLKKEDTDVSSLYSLNSEGGEDVFIEDAEGGSGGTPKKKYPGLATALAAAAGNLSSTTPWESSANNSIAKTILISSSGGGTKPTDESATTTTALVTGSPPNITNQQQHLLGSSPHGPLSPSEEPVNIEEKSLPKIPEEPPSLTTPTNNAAAAATNKSREQRSLSVVIMQPIQLLPKYLRLNKSDLDLSEQQQQENQSNNSKHDGNKELVVKDVDVSVTTQQEIWTMLQKERRYMDRNIYVDEEDEHDDDGENPEGDEDDDDDEEEEEELSHSHRRYKNKKLKSPTVAKPISLLLEGGARASSSSSGGGSRLQLAKTDLEHEWINGAPTTSAAAAAVTTTSSSSSSQQQVTPHHQHHHRRLSMQPRLNHPQIRTLSSSTTTLTTSTTSHQQHSSSSRFQFPNQASSISSSSSTGPRHRPIPSYTTTASSEDINKHPHAHAHGHAHPHHHHHHPPTSNLSAKNRSYSVPRRLDNSQLNLSEINLDVSLLPIFHKILSERSRSLREARSSGEGLDRRGAGGGSTSEVAAAAAAARGAGSGALRRGNNKRANNNLMLSCPNIMIKCDIVEYL